MLERFRRDKGIAETLLKRIDNLIDRDTNLMEVCGTHTQAISSSGIRRAVDKRLRLLSGPGCPVCVTPQEEIDAVIELSKDRDLIIITFGDMLRVPGSDGSLEDAKSRGADVRVVYSAIDSIEIAKANPRKGVIFLGVGFETTAPTVASVILKAKEMGIKNLFLLPLFKLIPPALYKIASSKELRVDGFILPGHVSTIIGSKPYGFLPKRFKKPCVIAGFEPIDILQAIYMLLLQLKEDHPEVEIQYKRSVREEGNPKALELMDRVFKKRDSNWRGIGRIERSGLCLSPLYQEFDAGSRFKITIKEAKINPLCRCGEVLLGLAFPYECPLFADPCTPSSPIGPCMVSSEGACSAYYKYER